MLDNSEGFHRRRSNPLGGRIGGDKLRMLSLKLLELFHQLIVLGVADFRAVEHVVAVVMIIDGLSQLFYPPRDFVCVFHEANPYS